MKWPPLPCPALWQLRKHGASGEQAMPRPYQGTFVRADGAGPLFHPPVLEPIQYEIIANSVCILIIHIPSVVSLISRADLHGYTEPCSEERPKLDESEHSRPYADMVGRA